MPELGEGVEQADVAEILVEEGDTIEADQNVMELETEKAVADLPCPHAGRIAKIHVAEGDSVRIGELLLTIEDEGEEDDAQEKREEKAEDTAEDGVPDDESEEDGKDGRQTREEEQEHEKKQGREREKEREKEKGQEQGQEKEKGGKKSERKRGGEKEGGGAEDAERTVPAGPATRRLARKLDVPLEEVEGSGPGGRITQEDVVHEHDARRGGTQAEPELPDFSDHSEVERESLSAVRRTAAEQLATSARVIPHVTQHAFADVTDVEQQRRSHNARLEDDAAGITLTAMAAKAAAVALQEFPRFNSSFDAARNELVIKRSYHIGVAVATDDGLLVPVVRDADRKSLSKISEEVSELARKARDGKLTAEEMRGATFSISNQGPVDAGTALPPHLYGTFFTPIIPWPQAAILGLARARRQLEVVEDRPEMRLMLPLSLSYDHRISDGADAIQFIGRISELLSRSFELAAG